MLTPLFSALILIIMAYIIQKTKKNLLALWFSRLLRLISIPCIMFAAFVFWATPAITLPEPSGQHTVALSHWVIKTDRPETYTLDPADKRMLHVKVWYPTANVSNINFSRYKPVPQHASYASAGMAKIHAAGIGSIGPLSFLEPRLNTSIENTTLAAYSGTAPLKTDETFPVLLFSHGHRAHLDFFSTTMQDIASHGYIVVGINHSYEVPHSVMPTGETLIRTDTALENTPALSSSHYSAYEKRLSDNYARIEQLTSNALYKKNERTFFDAYNTIIDTPQDLTRDLPIRIADMQSVMQFLEKGAEQPKASALFSAMDLSKVGAFGMSFGGPTSAEFCRLYMKCFAAANIDGKNWGNMLRSPVNVPMLWIAGTYTDNERFDVPYTLEHWASDAFRVFVPGALHQAFTDAPFLSPVIELATLEYPYNIQPTGHIFDIHKITNRALVNFFNHYAKEKPLALKSLGDNLLGVRVEEYRQ
jgi:dienelactone hydrolase